MPVGFGDIGCECLTGLDMPRNVAQYGEFQPVIHELLRKFAQNPGTQPKERVGKARGRNGDPVQILAIGFPDHVKRIELRALGGQFEDREIPVTMKDCGHAGILRERLQLIKPSADCRAGETLV